MQFGHKFAAQQGAREGRSTLTRYVSEEWYDGDETAIGVVHGCRALLPRR